MAEEGDFDLRRAPRQRSILEALIRREANVRLRTF